MPICFSCQETYRQSFGSCNFGLIHPNDHAVAKSYFSQSEVLFTRLIYFAKFPERAPLFDFLLYSDLDIYIYNVDSYVYYAPTDPTRDSEKDADEEVVASEETENDEFCDQRGTPRTDMRRNRVG